YTNPRHTEGLMNGASTAAPTTTDAFASAMEKAVEMTRYLESGKALAATHSELEAFVAEEGRELLRRMLQGHHALRVLAERAARVRCTACPSRRCRPRVPEVPAAERAPGGQYRRARGHRPLRVPGPWGCRSSSDGRGAQPSAGAVLARRSSSGSGTCGAGIL